MKSFLSFLCQSQRLHLAALGALVLAITVPGIGESEPFVNGDESRHAVTGVFFRDALIDSPWQNPVGYANEYYVHYPALGVIHWPPMFHMVQGLFVAVLGISAVTSRIAVLAFALLLVLYFYRLTKDLFSGPVALCASVLLFSTSAVVFYSRVVMLEIPSLALCVAALFHYNRYLGDRGRRHLWLAFVFFTFAVMTRQHSLFLGPLFLIAPCVAGRWRQLLRKEFFLAGFCSALVVVPYYAYTMVTHGQSVANDALVGARGREFLTSLPNLTYYIRHLPKQAGTWIPALAALSIVAALIARHKPSRMPILWIVLCFVLFTLTAQKDSRYVIYWLPPICAMAASGVLLLGRAGRWKPVGAGAVCLLVICAAVSAVRVERPYVRGYEAAARYVGERNGDSPIFFQGELNGSFILYTMARDEEKGKRSLVIRGSKLIYFTNILNRYGQEQLVHTKEGILDAFDKNGIRFAVVENKNILDAPGYDMLMETLESDDFKLHKTIPVESNDPRFQNLSLEIFEYRKAKYPENLVVELQMKTVGKSIKVKVR